jgi:predicted TIM-barrel fold metal-dependent hydrolase
MPALGQSATKIAFFHMVCHPWEMQGACLDIVCGGVLSKFPKLKVAFLEAGLGGSVIGLIAWTVAWTRWATTSLAHA